MRGTALAVLLFFGLCLQAKTAQQYLEEAQSKLAEKDYAAAIEAADQYILREPESAAGFMLRAEAYTELGMFTDALGNLQTAQQLAPDDTMTQFLIGYVYSEMGDFKAAKPYLDKMIAATPGFYPPYQFRMLYFLDAGETDKALNDVKMWLKLQPGDLEGHYYEALILAEQGKFGDAMDICNELLSPPAPYSQAYALRGKCYYALGQYEEAAGDLMQAVEADPSLENLSILGSAAMELGDIDLAHESLSKAMRTPGVGAKEYYNMGLTELARGQYDSSEHYLGIVTKLEPNNGDAWYMLGMAFEKRSDIENALWAYENAEDAGTEYKAATAIFKLKSIRFVSANWLYLLVALIALIVLFASLRKRKKKKKLAVA